MWYGEDYKYKYPAKLRLKPGCEFHDKLRDRIMRRANDSALFISERHASWRQIDKSLTGFVPDKETVSTLNRTKQHCLRDINYGDVILPYSTLILETLLSAFNGVFLVDPIFKYVGLGPSDILGAITLERLIALQCRVTKVSLALHTMARDSFVYGFGAATPTWYTEYRTSHITNSLDFGATGTRDILSFEGNALENIDPYLYLPDPEVPIALPQKGQFVGWIGHKSYYDLLSDENGEDSGLFNCKYLKNKAIRKTSIFSAYTEDARDYRTGLASPHTTNYTMGSREQQVDIINMFCKVIPKEWGLGSGEIPEIWFFQLAGDSIIIKAEKSNLSHKQFPVAVIAPDFDGYCKSPISRLEMLHGLQNSVDFLLDSRMREVRKGLRNKFVVDPMMINVSDVLNNDPDYNLIRTRRDAWGRGIAGFIQQLPVNDVSRNNVAELGWLNTLMDRISGADQAQQGGLRTSGPDRLTSAEFSSTRLGGLTRMDRIAKIISQQGLTDIAKLFAYHNQQFMTMEIYVETIDKIQRQYIEHLGGKLEADRLIANPTNIDINFSVKITDSTTSEGNFTGEWVQLFQTISTNPQLVQEIDTVQLFLYIAKNMGAKEINNFLRRGQMAVAPDSVVNELAGGGPV